MVVGQAGREHAVQSVQRQQRLAGFVFDRDQEPAVLVFRDGR
jgi:hypothetical protein